MENLWLAESPVWFGYEMGAKPSLNPQLIKGCESKLNQGDT